MLNPNELRKGNIVLQDGEIINDITALSIHKFNLGQIKLTSIPITKQWLLMLGFEYDNAEKQFTYKIDDTMQYKLQWSEINNEIHSIGICYGHDGDKNLYNFVWNIKYIHRLQNIMYELTNKEPTISGQL